MQYTFFKKGQALKIVNYNTELKTGKLKKNWSFQDIVLTISERKR